MIRTSVRVVGAIAAVLFVVGTAPAAWAGTGNQMPHGMPWDSPNKVLSGVPVEVASIKSCPPPPTAGDTVLVQIFLSFGQGGGSGQIVSANPDGSWAGPVTFGFSGVTLRHTTISATCVDYNGVTGVSYAAYQTRHTQVFP